MRGIENFFYSYLENQLPLSDFYSIFIDDYLFYIKSNEGGIMFNQLNKRPIIPAFLQEKDCEHYTKYKYKAWKLKGSLFIDIAPYGYDLLIYGKSRRNILLKYAFLDEIVKINLE